MPQQFNVELAWCLYLHTLLACIPATFSTTTTHTGRGELVGNLSNIREEVTFTPVSHGRHPNIFVLEKHNYTKLYRRTLTVSVCNKIKLNTQMINSLAGVSITQRIVGNAVIFSSPPLTTVIEALGLLFR